MGLLRAHCLDVGQYPSAGRADRAPGADIPRKGERHSEGQEEREHRQTDHSCTEHDVREGLQAAVDCGAT